ncbi:helix-turn-helix domain-containing protein [Nonomuraea sp. NPDC059023]|uniref:helix-turn-helix domain-containing protein n=1 Tax=unclassified Nonomuraea TaxID=2593643 RepID=UPI003697719A
MIDRILNETSMSQAQLASLVPMDQSQLSRWRTGSSKPKHESLVAMGKALRKRYPAIGVGPEEMTAAVYSDDPAHLQLDDTQTAPASVAEKAAMDQVDAIRAAMRAELEPLRRQVSEQQEDLAAVRDELRALREQRADQDKAG